MGATNSRRDALVKYGYGGVRLGALLLVLRALGEPAPTIAPLRWAAFASLGVMGAMANAEAIRNKAILALGTVLAGALLLADLLTSSDTVILFYVSKTLIPDAFAGKIDSAFLRIVCVLFAAVLALFAVTAPTSSIGIGVLECGGVWIAHAIAQFICEYGDAHAERWAFFRHRYSYELACVLIWTTWPLGADGPFERRLLYLDMWACLAYRITNAAVTAAGCDYKRRAVIAASLKAEAVALDST
jgi:hypothetical protein